MVLAGGLGLACGCSTSTCSSDSMLWKITHPFQAVSRARAAKNGVIIPGPALDGPVIVDPGTCPLPGPADPILETTPPPLAPPLAPPPRLAPNGDHAQPMPSPP